MFNQLNQLTNLLEEITGNEVDIEIVQGNLLITITKNKRGAKVPSTDPLDDVKLPDMDELDNLHDFVSSLPS